MRSSSRGGCDADGMARVCNDGWLPGSCDCARAQVAVKTVLFSEREDGDTKLPHERAIMEAAVCTSVQHRNVVSTYQ